MEIIGSDKGNVKITTETVRHSNVMIIDVLHDLKVDKYEMNYSHIFH